ncbi:L,D-transpeptidase family protein [Lactococcus lactis]|uniref:L,D-transpeptidase family protein n=1 Tax=Lactococcus lactis TaxID=1358 RepID=UPI00050D6C0E|nr:L,D-transpeptidase family protein [Lactococcus lactis]AIS03134.1 hypothetical protein LG36_0534 [Lactococcus lactis]
MKIKTLVLATASVLAVGTFASMNQTKASADSSMPVYRLYNNNTGEHFYTKNNYERTSLINVGWNYEGIGWYGLSNGAPVYRVYNPNARGGDHYYTKSKYEAQSLVSKGWRWDNNGAPAFYSAGNTNLYVAYNPNASSGSHNYTTNSFEQNSLLNAGWKYGSIAFSVAKAGNPSGTEMRPMTGNYWQYSSELGGYPNLVNYNHLSIEVNISKNRTYLKSNNKVIYTFYSSAGVNNTTPSGNYTTQAETAPHFYNAGEGMGANYAVSWKDHGIYLFHSVPVDGNGNYIVSEANKLGKTPSSHGCIRLSISDSKWLYNQALSGTLPVGTPVSIIR